MKKIILTLLALVSSIALAQAAGDRVILNPNLDSDLLLQVNDGGVTTTVLTADGPTSNVGIGVSNPAAGTRLHIRAPVGAGNQIVYDRTDDNAMSLRVQNTNTGATTILGTERSTTGGLFVGSQANASVFGSESNTPLQLITNGTARMTIAAGGALTLGSAQNIIHTVNGGLDVNLNAGASALDVQNTDAGSGDSQLVRIIAQPTASTGTGAIIHVDNGGGAGTPILRLQHNGQLTLGDSVSDIATLVVTNNSATGNSIVQMENRAGTVNDLNERILQLSFDNTNNPTGGGFIIFRDSDTNPMGSITGASATTISFNTSSDKRLKYDIKPMENALERTLKLNPSSYKWKEDGHYDEGFIAQEVKKVYPYAVSGSEENDPMEQPMQVDYGKLTPLLAAAIKEQQALIEELQKKINALENK